MPHYVLEFDTERPPSPTVPLDYVVALAVPLFWCLCATLLWRTYRASKQMQQTGRMQVVATALMCAGASVHVLSAFVGNGHLASFGWFRSVQNAHCPLWDVWGRFACGFAVWFFGVALHQLHWIRTLSDFGHSADASTAAGDAATSRGKGYVFAGSAAARGSLRALATRDRLLSGWTVGVVMFGAIGAIALAVELAHGTEYSAAHHACYTAAWVKALLTAWIFGSMGALIWLLIVLRQRTRRVAFLRVCSGLGQSQRLLYVCTATLLLLLVINMVGLLSYSVPRALYTLALAAMYAYSIYTMHRITTTLYRADDNIERVAKRITFDTVWSLPSLRDSLLGYMERASNERDLRYDPGVNKLLVAIRVQDVRDRKHLLYRKLFHPGTALEQLSNASYAPALAEAPDDTSFCVVDEDDDDNDDAFSDDGPSGAATSARTAERLYDNVALSTAEDLSAQEQEAAAHVSRVDMCRFVRGVYAIDLLTKQSPTPPSARVLSAASKVVGEFFPVNLSGPSRVAVAELHTASDPVVDDTEDSTAPNDAAPSPSRTAAVDLESDEGVQQLYLNIERVCTEAALVRNRSAAQKLPIGDFLEMLPDRRRLQHLISADVSDLHAVYDVIISGGVDRVNTVLQFLYAMQTACRILIEAHYYHRALCNTGLAQQYERMLRARIGATGGECLV